MPLSIQPSKILVPMRIHLDSSMDELGGVSISGDWGIDEGKWCFYQNWWVRAGKHGNLWWSNTGDLPWHLEARAQRRSNHMGVSENMGDPQKRWMVFLSGNIPSKKWMILLGVAPWLWRFPGMMMSSSILWIPLKHHRLQASTSGGSKSNDFFCFFPSRSMYTWFTPPQFPYDCMIAWFIAELYTIPIPLHTCISMHHCHPMQTSTSILA